MTSNSDASTPSPSPLPLQGGEDKGGDTPNAAQGPLNPAPVSGLPAQASVHVKLPIYDGPLDLLLDLIKKNEMDIYDIPIAEITRQYLESLSQMKQLDLEIAGEYVVVAATLIYIKSKMLLPQDGEDEEELGEDPRSELVRRLLEYQAFKRAAKEFGLLEGERGKMFTRQISEYYLSELDEESVEIDSFSANLYDLLSAFQNVVMRIGHVDMHEVFEQVISVEEKMAEIQAVLLEKKRIVFSSLFQGTRSKNLLIATFLAVLEIIRTRFARVFQDKHFGEIVIEKTTETA